MFDEGHVEIGASKTQGIEISLVQYETLNSSCEISTNVTIDRQQLRDLIVALNYIWDQTSTMYKETKSED